MRTAIGRHESSFNSISFQLSNRSHQEIRFMIPDIYGAMIKHEIPGRSALGISLGNILLQKADFDLPVFRAAKAISLVC